MPVTPSARGPGMRWSQAAEQPCTACPNFVFCAAVDIACQDFGFWVEMNQHRSLSRDPTPGLFDLIFERADAAETATDEDRALYLEIGAINSRAKAKNGPVAE